MVEYCGGIVEIRVSVAAAGPPSAQKWAWIAKKSAEKADFCRLLQTFAEFSECVKFRKTLLVGRLAIWGQEKVCNFGDFFPV